jgi:hypothetical protein
MAQILGLHTKRKGVVSSKTKRKGVTAINGHIILDFTETSAARS